MQEKILDLLKRAALISKNAYAPYSKYKVGCAILLNDGRIFTGVNIENASYPVSICAERSAMTGIVVEKAYDQIALVAIVSDSTVPSSPCGMCRQFLGEFLKSDTPIILGNQMLEFSTSTMDELLPMAFDKSFLV